MNKTNPGCFTKGMRDGFPIFLGYFAVSFTLGIAAKNAGLTPIQAALTSLTVNASAGEAAGFNLIAQNASYIELAIMILIANARYILMSCALSQKLKPGTSLIHRLLIGTDVTDEIFALSVSVNGWLNPFYTYGIITVAAPGWAVGTYLGVLLGNILPPDVVSALSVGLYGMFIAIIIPPARENKIILSLVIISMLLSYLTSVIPWFEAFSGGTVIIILTLVISLAAAIIFPVSENGGQKEGDENEA